jgi:UDP-glucose 4-epimerase
MLNEESTPNPETFYGISKLRAETHVKRLFNKINTLIIRGGNVYGYSPSMRFDAVINRFMFDANFNNRISINGNGKQHRSFIHIDKLVAGLAQVILREIPSGVYNLTDKNVQVLDLIDVFKEIFPSLEFLFINQHLTLKEVRIESESKIRQYVSLPESSLKQELINFKEKFAFSSSDVVLQDKGYGQGI